MTEIYERKVAQAVSLRLPVCPGVNALHRTIVRPGVRFPTVIKSERYREWLKQAGYELELQKPGQVEGPFGMRMSVPCKARCDLDAYLKATLDLLEAHQIIVNDKYCQRIEIWRSEQTDMFVQILATNKVGGTDEPKRKSRTNSALQSCASKADATN